MSPGRFSKITVILLTSTVFWGSSRAESEQCEVTDISVTSNETASTYSFHLIFKNSTCSKKDGLKILKESCDGTGSTTILLLEDEHKILKSAERGPWRITVNEKSRVMDPLESACFYTMGLMLYQPMSITLDYKKLLIMINNNDSRVKGWTLDTYERRQHKGGENFVCEGKTLYDIEEEMRLNSLLKPQEVTPNLIKMTHDFDPNTCYCFVMNVKSTVKMNRNYRTITTRDCRPLNIVTDGQVVQDEKPPSRVVSSLVVVLLVVVTVLGGVTFFVPARFWPKCLKDILSLRRRTKRNYAPCPHKLQGKEVLLLHAQDTSGCEDMMKLKQFLRTDFKVHGIFESYDPERLADPSEWLLAMLQKGPEVKLLLVESAGLQDLMRSLLETSVDSDNMTVLGKGTKVYDSNSLLILALRQILCTELRQDYTRVFVVRFSDSQQQGCLQVEDGVDLVVKTKRYCLPSHYLMLKEEMLR